MQTVTQLEAAERQLVAAIKIFFDSGDEVAIHMLASHSHEILDRLCAKKDLQRGVIEEGLKNVRPELRKTVIDKINKAKNYFKHGDSNPEEILSWEPKVTEYFIWDATSLHRKLAGMQKTPEIIFYDLWFRIHHDDMWVEANREETGLDVLLAAVKPELSNLSKKDFLEACRMTWQQGGFNSK